MTDTKSTDPLDLDAIEARAKAATPGPWRECGRGKKNGCSCGQVWSIPADSNIAIATNSSHYDKDDLEAQENTPNDREITKANAAHIAGMDPPTTLALIARIRELEAALEPFIRHYEPWMDDYPDDTRSSTYSIHTIGDIRRARAASSAALHSSPDVLE